MEGCLDRLTAKQTMGDVSVHKDRRKILHVCCACVLTIEELVSAVKSLFYGASIPEKAR